MVAAGHSGEQEAPVPVVLDTDIGVDVDALFALAFILASPELQLAGVTTVSGDVRMRARTACALLEAAGRQDVPVAAGSQAGCGCDQPSEAPPNVDARSAASLLLQMAGLHEGALCLITTGPLTNAARMARDHPCAFRSLRGLFIQGGDFKGVDARSIRPEESFRLDPPAADMVLTSGAPVLLCGLNATRRTSLSPARLNELEALDTPRARLLASAVRHSVPSGAAAPLHAAVAAAALFRSKLITWRSLPARVQTVGPEAGVLAFERKPSRTACGVRVAVDLDVEGFESLFWRRICAFAGET